MPVSTSTSNRFAVSLDDAPKHTVFGANDFPVHDDLDQREFLDYARWYQGTMREIYTLRERGITDKASFILELLVTKNWRSKNPVFVWIVIAVLGFATAYWSINGLFEPGKRISFFEAVYFSTVTLTTLGYSLHPVQPIGKILVMTEVVIGYLALALLVYMLQVKSTRKF